MADILEFAAFRDRPHRCKHDWRECATPVTDARGAVKKETLCRWCGVSKFPRWKDVLTPAQFAQTYEFPPIYG